MIVACECHQKMKLQMIILFFVYTVHCKSADLSDYYLDDPQSDNYEEYEQEGLEDRPEESNAPKQEDDKTVTLISKPDTFIKNLSETVVLPCEISDSDFVRLWRKNGVILFHSTVAMTKAPNLKVKDGNLEISDLREEDAGQYQCSVMITQKYRPKITHTLKVRTPPRIEFLKAKDNRHVLKSGETLQLTCKANGYPKPFISWHRGSERLPNMEGEVLTIERFQRRDVGEYKCLADNKIGKPAFSVIHIKVEHKPMVEIDQISVSSDHNIDNELKCIVHAEPPANVVWKKDGKNIKNSEHTVLSTDKTAHILVIKSLQESDFGVYACFAVNYLGNTSKTISLVKTPAILRFIKPPSDTKDVVLTWEVQSKSPVSEHELQYRKKGEVDWHHVKPEVHNVKDEIYTVKYELKDLGPGTYETRMRSQNNHGWSEYSEIMPFEGVVIKHGHHRSHKKGHRDGKAKQIQSTQETPGTTQSTKISNPGVPAEHQENVTIKDMPVEATDTSGCSSLMSMMTLISMSSVIVLQIKPSIIRI